MNWKEVTTIVMMILLIGCLINHRGKTKSQAEYTKEQICDAIYIIEGGQKTRYPYGIKSVFCEGKAECRQVCFNTVLNNKKRYTDYGHRKYKTYLEFLASRYCPEGELCQNWLPNLRFYLQKGE